MAALNRTFVFFVVVFIALNVWAAISPSHYNWGFHYFAFLSPAISIGLLVLTGVTLVPQVRTAVLSWLSIVTRWTGKRSTVTLFILLFVVWVGLILLFPEKLHLLGDSGLILRFTPKMPSIENLNANFRNQPLTYESLRLIQWLIGAGHVVEPLYLYRVTDLLMGILYLGLIFYFLPDLSKIKSPVSGILVV